MSESDLELSTLSLEEQEKTATSLEDIYGYKVLTEVFQKQIDNYNTLKQQEQKLSLEYVFKRESRDMVMDAFETVMHTETSIVVGNEYEEKVEKGDSILVIAGFTMLGVLITGLIWSFVENRRKGKKKYEDYSDNGASFFGAND